MLGIRLLVGLCLMLFGRKLFWVFVAAIGFAAGLHFAMHFLVHQSDLTVLLIALGCGAAGALLAIFLQKVAIAVAGFAGGATILVHILLSWTTVNPQYAWLAALIGGIVGAILMMALFDWALIILSSLLGAALVAEILPLSPMLQAASYVGLVIVGLVAQSLFRKSRARSE